MEALAGGTLPPGYWELAAEYQGQAVNEEEVKDSAFGAFVLLLVSPVEKLGRAEISYSIADTMRSTMKRYPRGLLPFADDTGGNLWAFDYRADPASPAIVFVDHELAGEAGITAVAPDFATLLKRMGIAAP